MAGSRPCKVLNVAEKNDAAKELAKVMSRGHFQRREGFSKFNKIYEFDFNILGKNCRMVMTSVSGHLMSLDFILAYKNWKNCSPETLFTGEIRKFCPDNFQPIKRTLEREVRGCQHLILWTDGDREGENIADEISAVCTQVKPRLQVHRARFSEITPQSIMRACHNLGVLDQRVSDAVKVRQEVDLRIGCAFTRFQTMRLSKAFPHVLSDQLISYGPCQFPTLGFVVERTMAGSRPCKVLNVAEKNDAAKELAKVMSRGHFQRREGFSKFNKIYEFDFNILGKTSKPFFQNCRMVMTSVSGHLMSLDFILAYKNWKNCSPETLFTGEIRKFCPDNFQPIKRTLEREVRGCQHLILWTDGDREGENIADEISAVCTQVKPRLQVHRARFSEITPQSIMRACHNLGVLDQRVSDAVKVRQEVDLRIGCAFTRFQTMRLSKAFPHVLSDQLISYGPCQFPTLGFVVERYKQVQTFIPETFYKIKVTHESGEGKVEFNWKRVRVFNHTVCLILYQICLESPTARVVSTHSRPRNKWRPLPLDTVELEKQASRKLRINAKETMRIAEKLYTQGYISYPRTETNIFPDSFDLAAIVRDQTGDPDWGAFASQLLARGPTPRQGNKTDNAHPPIHPTKYANSLQGNEKRIYEYVVRHFLACCSQDAQGQETTVEIEVAGEKFSAQGLMITARNYLDVFPYDRWSAKTIPVYQQGSTFQPTSIEMSEGETTPPPLLHEADLIALMEKHGIGTDATHAEHIETIKSRNYVGVQSDGCFVPGELGMGLVEGYDAMGYELSKPMLRAELESDLKRICEGRKVKEDVLTVTLRKYKDVFLIAQQQAHKLDEALSKHFGPPQQVTENEPPVLSEVVRRCPLCQQSDLVVKRKRDGGYMLCCLGFPECRAVQFFPSYVTDVAPHPSSCNACQPQPVHKLKFKFKSGSVPPFLGLEYVACSSCDSTLRYELDFGPIRRSNPNPNESSSSASTSRRSSSQSQPQQSFSSSRNRSSSSSGRNTGRGSGQTAPRTSGFGSSQPSNWDLNMSGRGRGVGSLAGSSTFSPSTQFSSGYGSRTDSFSQFSASTSSNFPVCNCGEAAVLLTVKKAGPNKGRQFYKCSKRESACDFFLWADQLPTDNRGSASGSISGGDRSMSFGYGSMHSQGFHGGPGFLTASKKGKKSGPGSGGDSGGVVCNCGTAAVHRTVQKEGPNKGRQFYTCPKPREEQCGFFEWADDVPSSHIHSGRGGGSGRRGPTSSPGGEGKRRRAPPTCSVCRQPGHTKRTCPQARETE